MRILGLFLIFAAVVIPLQLYANLFGKYEGVALISQYLGSVSARSWPPA